MGLCFVELAVFMCMACVLLSRFMSDAESREQPRGETTPRHIIARSEREHSEPAAGASREQARIADMQRCIDSMRRTAGDLEARVADLECSVGRIGSAFGQMAGLHDVVNGGASRPSRNGGFSERGGRRDFSSRSEPFRGGHGPPSFGNGGDFGGRGRGRR